MPKQSPVRRLQNCYSSPRTPRFLIFPVGERVKVGIALLNALALQVRADFIPRRVWFFRAACYTLHQTLLHYLNDCCYYTPIG